MKALGNHVLVKPVELKETAGELGLILKPETSMDREKFTQDEGTVVSIGPCAFAEFSVEYDDHVDQGAEAWGVKEGDRVLYNPNGARWVKDPDTQEEFMLFNDREMLVLLKGE